MHESYAEFGGHLILNAVEKQIRDEKKITKINDFIFGFDLLDWDYFPLQNVSNRNSIPNQ